MRETWRLVNRCYPQENRKHNNQEEGKGAESRDEEEEEAEDVW